MDQPAYTERLDRAMALALQAFRHTRRKCTPVPYVTHLMAVTALVGEHGGDEDMLIAALLHDYLEDIPEGTAEDLERDFGPRVARLVLAVSDCVTLPKPPWRDRKQAYLDHLRHQPGDVKLISAADKLHNCTTIVRDHRVQGDVVFERFKPTKEQTCWYYRGCLEQLRVGWDHVILHDLDAVVRALHLAAGVPG